MAGLLEKLFLGFDFSTQQVRMHWPQLVTKYIVIVCKWPVYHGVECRNQNSVEILTVRSRATVPLQAPTGTTHKVHVLCSRPKKSNDISSNPDPSPRIARPNFPVRYTIHA